jgi:hypothetical protein
VVRVTVFVVAVLVVIVMVVDVTVVDVTVDVKQRPHSFGQVWEINSLLHRPTFDSI